MKMSPEASKRLNDLNAGFDDWVAQCPKCGSVLKGTLAQLKEHKCGNESRRDAATPAG